MTIEETIKRLEIIATNLCGQSAQNPNLWPDYKAVDMAISALRAKQGQERNAPLTLDELRKMGGEPVFVVTDRLKEWCLVHSHNSDDVIGGGIIMTRRTAEKRTYQYACYGKTWLAYRQKPEEDDHDERKENENA